MTSQRVVTFVCCALMTGCATLTAGVGSRLPFEPVASLPAGWGTYSRPISGDCPDVSGDYQMTADLVEIRKDVTRESTSDAFVYFSLFVGPLQGIDYGREQDDRAPMLTLEQPDAGALVLRARIPDPGKRNAWRFPLESGGLHCDDGFFYLPIEEVSEVVEGTSLNYQSYRRFTAVDDGSLVYYKQFGPLKNLLGIKRAFTHQFYRFKRVNE